MCFGAAVLVVWFFCWCRCCRQRKVIVEKADEEDEVNEGEEDDENEEDDEDDEI